MFFAFAEPQNINHKKMFHFAVNIPAILSTLPNVKQNKLDLLYFGFTNTNLYER